MGTHPCRQGGSSCGGSGRALPRSRAPRGAVANQELRRVVGVPGGDRPPGLVRSEVFWAPSAGQEGDEGRLAVLAQVLEQSENGPRIEEAFTEVLESFGHAVPDLARFLTDEEFLARLDDPEMFMHTRIPDRRLHRLLSRLASASTPEATGVLSSLSSHPIYRDIAVREAVQRRDTLVVALGGLRKPTDQILDFIEESTLGRFPVLAYSVPTLVRMDSPRAHAIALAGLERPQEMQ